eukprot:634545-Hanusia_phi.AAC.1
MHDKEHGSKKQLLEVINYLCQQPSVQEYIERSDRLLNKTAGEMAEEISQQTDEAITAALKGRWEANKQYGAAKVCEEESTRGEGAGAVREKREGEALTPRFLTVDLRKEDIKKRLLYIDLSSWTSVTSREHQETMSQAEKSRITRMQKDQAFDTMPFLEANSSVNVQPENDNKTG